MIRKQYIAPLTESVMVEVGKMVCTSIMSGGSAQGNGVVSGESRMQESIFFEVVNEMNTENILGL